MPQRALAQPFAVLILVLLLALGAAAAVAEPLGLTPAPQAIKTKPGTCRLPTLTYSCSGPTSPPVDYALEVLARTLGATPRRVPPAEAAIRLMVATATELTAAASKAGLNPAPQDRARESYVLDCGFSDPARILLTGGPVGLVYGIHTLAQLAVRGDLRQAPQLAISDWPSFLSRAWTGVPRNPADPATGKLLDWFARWRINTCYYEIYGDAGQDSVPPEVTQLQRECARRGIALYGQISNWRTELLLKRELCACNPDDIAHLRRYATELLDRGCDGLILLFDDITQAAVEHPLTCPLCQQRFKGLAEAQVELMRPMLEVARARGVDRLIVCPTPYYVGWEDTQLHKLPGKAYYAAWAKADVMKGVQVYHCLLREKDITAVQQAGLRNFIYWYNGNRDYEACLPNGQRVQGLWGGFTELAFGWYGYRWDTARGVVPLPDTYDAFRRMPALTQHVWLCSGGDYPFALWGAYCWNAEKFDPTQTERDILQACYGPTAPAEYARWRDVARKWYPRLLAPPGGLSAVARAAFLKGLATDAETAKQAALAFAAKQQFTGGEDIAPRLLTSAETLAQAAATADTGQSTARLEDWTERGTGTARQRERQMEINDFWSRYALRYSQTTDADGTKHRTQWHFGSGLGMQGPSYRNWYDAGFMDVLVNGKSLEGITPEFRVEGGALVGLWATEAGELTLTFSIQEGGLRIAGALAGDKEASVAVQLFAIPGAGQGAWSDMDKYVVSAAGETTHGTPVTLRPGDNWLFLADRTYDVPHEQAEGPCAVAFTTPVPAIRCDNGVYVVQIDADYPAGTRKFAFVVYDFHGQKNADALADFKRLLGSLTQ